MINKIKTQIISDNLEMYYNNGSQVKITLIDENNNILSNKTIILNINGIEYKRTTNSNGTAFMKIKLNSGVYAIKLTYAGDEKYEESFKNITVNVKPTLIANNLTKFFRNNTQFLVKVLDQKGELLVNQEVTININGVFYTRKTNSSGIAKLNINLEAGEYILTTNNEVTNEKTANKVTVLSLIQENHDLVKYYRNASQYTVKLYNKDGSPAIGENVTFNINGVFYTRQANASGIAKLNINLAPDDYIITAEYKDCRISNNIKVLPILYANDLKMKYHDNSQFKVKLVDGNGNPFSNQNIIFNINGIFYNRMTKDDGIAALNIRLQAGEYIITSSYNNSNIANKITISG